MEKTAEDTEKRTTMTLSLTTSDKKALKQIALDRGITVASLVHAWIVECEQRRQGDVAEESARNV
jgi:hypothetical protein